MSDRLRILLLDDNPLDADLALAHLTDAGVEYDAERVDAREAFERALAWSAPGVDLILAEHRLPAFDGMSALQIARDLRPDVPFIFLSGTLGEELATEAMRLGATDYVLKQRLGRLVPSVRRAMREAGERRALERARADLRRSEERCRLLVENATDFAILMLDADGRIESWAGGAEGLLGHTEADVLGRPYDLIFTPEQRSAGVPARDLARAAADGRVPDDCWHVRKDGSRFFASGVMTALRDGRGARPRGFLKILRDTTEKQRRDESLRRTSENLRLLGETASYLLSHAGAREVIKDLVDKLSAHLGLEVYVAYLVADDPAATGGQFLNLLASANLPEPLDDRYRRVAVGGQGACGRVAGTGDRIVVEDVQRSTDPALALARSAGVWAYACHPLAAHGRVIGTLAFGTRTRTRFEPDELALMQTVCDQIAAALERDRLLEREQAARHRAETLAGQAADSARDAEAANRAKDEFLATVSHELRTPLTAILGWARVLSSPAEPGGIGGAVAVIDAETLREGLETIERNANAQAQLVDDILDISRIVNGKMRLHVGPTDLAPVVREAADALRLAADAKGVVLRLVLPATAGDGNGDGSAVVSGDPDRLRQVAWNLLSNAIKFTPPGGTVTVAVARAAAGRQARLTVTDTGRGIAPHFLPHIFERFRQADASSTRRHGGLGLGLAICRYVVELHGGTIDARSDGEGHGAMFIVTLPTAMPTAAARAGDAEPRDAYPSHDAALPAGPPPAVECPPSLDGLRVLVVDDEPDARRLVATVLQKCRADVATASCVTEALAMIDHQRPDVLLSDIGMPGQDGYALIAQVRRRPAAAGGDVPAVALTAYTRPEDRARALASGFQAFLTKPVEPADLVRAVADAAGMVVEVAARFPSHSVAP